MKTQAGTAAPTIALGDLIALGKPRITMMVLITTAAGIYLAPSPLNLARAITTLIGVALVVAAANAFNMVLERDVDALMRRTRNRPLPAGRLTPDVAVGFGIFCVVIALPLVRAGANPLTAALSFASLVLYVFAYTPLKRRSPWALVVGAVPGAIPPLMGWTASTGHIGAPGLAIFGVLFVWQIPHFIAITLFRAEEYARAGLKVDVVVRGVDAARWRIIGWSVVQFAASLFVIKSGVGGRFYEGAAFSLGAVLLALCGYALRPMSDEKTQRWARWFFLYSLVYLPVLFTTLVIGR
jgi:protoheme IX farnesyltransferase